MLSTDLSTGLSTDLSTGQRTVTVTCPIPDWARFIATDADGLVAAYEQRPAVVAEEDGCGQWMAPRGARVEVVAYGVVPAAWHETLRELG